MLARVPDAVQRAALLRRAGTHFAPCQPTWTPVLQRIAPRCIAPGDRPMQLIANKQPPALPPTAFSRGSFFVFTSDI